MKMISSLLRDSRLPRFLLAGGCCFITNLTVLYVGTDLLHLHYLASMAISIVIANTLGWALNRTWTFASNTTNWRHEYGKYLTVNLGGFAISLVLMALFVSMLDFHYLLASGLIAIGMTLINFMLHRDWSFASKD